MIAVLILCGSQLRHKFFAISLLKEFPNSYVVVERSNPNVCRQGSNTPLITKHFNEFIEAEERFFRKFVDENEAFLDERTLYTVDFGCIHTIYSGIISLEPKLLVVYSTSLLKKKLIDAFPNKIINLHGGLSPYYRGAGTNFYPFYDERLDCVGMTVHFLDAGIDSGSIILQGRPKFEVGDDTHSIGCKCVYVGVNLMKQVVSHWIEFGSCPSSYHLRLTGSLRLKKEFSDEHILKVQKLLEKGLIESFLASRWDGVEIVNRIG